MNYYREITILPNADISFYFIWQKLYQQIHLALVENKTGMTHPPLVWRFQNTMPINILWEKKCDCSQKTRNYWNKCNVKNGSTGSKIMRILA